MEYKQSIQDELTCSVCMCLFKNPVTIECGHTLCSLCLFTHTLSKNFCPICRTALTYISEHPRKDQILNNIVQSIRNDESYNQLKKENKDKQIVVDHFQHLLLLDIHCNDLLLPFTKVTATFQLQSSALHDHLQRFVTRQSIPFNKYGIVSKIRNLSQLSFNIYKGQIEGKSFCQITEQQIKHKSNEYQQCSYRVCQAKIIYNENESIDKSLIKDYLQKFKLIKNKQILQKINELIFPQNLFSQSNLIASYYSIVRMLPQNNIKKYHTVISFDQKNKQQLLKEFLGKINYDVSKYPWKFVSVQKQKYLLRNGLLMVMITFIFVVFYINLFMR